MVKRDMAELYLDCSHKTEMPSIWLGANSQFSTFLSCQFERVDPVCNCCHALIDCSRSSGCKFRLAGSLPHQEHQQSGKDGQPQ